LFYSAREQNESTPFQVNREIVASWRTRVDVVGRFCETPASDTDALQASQFARRNSGDGLPTGRLFSIQRREGTPSPTPGGSYDWHVPAPKIGALASRGALQRFAHFRWLG